MVPWIVIKHVAGPQAHRIDQFALDGTKELTVGRSRGANVVFDGPLEDAVSRRHALIRVARDGTPRFTITDLGSVNGVRVNGQAIAGERALRPDDVIELSPGGPAFSIAVEPEPAAVTAGSDIGGRAAAVFRIGRHVLGVAALAAIGTSVVVLIFEQYGQPAGKPAVVAIAAHSEPAVPPPVARTVAPVAAPSVNPADAIVSVQATWRLYDRFTGKPVFQKIMTRRGQRLPCFVDLGNGRIVPWLTTEDEEHTNLPIGASLGGTGLIVSATGSLVTARRVAAGWTAPYRGDAASHGRVALYRLQHGAEPATPSLLADLSMADGDASWIPSEGDMLFHARYPAPFGEASSRFEGRNEVLNIRLPGARESAPARLMRLAAVAGLAELRIDSDAPLPAIALTADATLQANEPVKILAYPMAANPPGDIAVETPKPASFGATIGPADDAGRIGLAPLQIPEPLAGEIDGGAVRAEDGTVLGIVVSDASGRRAVAPARLIRQLSQKP
jgi:hypothetical protein